MRDVMCLKKNYYRFQISWVTVFWNAVCRLYITRQIKRVIDFNEFQYEGIYWPYLNMSVFILSTT